MPAQVVEIVDGNDYYEETRYFLPMGKGINSSLITQAIKEMGVEIDRFEFYHQLETHREVFPNYDNSFAKGKT